MSKSRHHPTRALFALTFAVFTTVAGCSGPASKFTDDEVNRLQVQAAKPTPKPLAAADIDDDEVKILKSFVPILKGMVAGRAQMRQRLEADQVTKKTAWEDAQDKKKRAKDAFADAAKADRADRERDLDEAIRLEDLAKDAFANAVKALGDFEKSSPFAGGGSRSSVDLSPLEARLKTLEDKPAPAAVDLNPLMARVKELEDKPTPKPVSLTLIEARVKALEDKAALPVAPRDK